jgi:plastocyanin
MKNLMMIAGVIGFSFASHAFAVCDTSKVINVEIRDMKYFPSHIDICAGQTVTWTNKEPIPVGDQEPMKHTVTADPARTNTPSNMLLPEGVAPFHSKGIAPGASWSYTFSVIGDYKYFCVPHQNMGHLGSITVTESEPVVIPVVAPVAAASCDTTKIINVEIRDEKYFPSHIDICAGQTVTWTNKEPIPAAGQEPMKHTVTADPTKTNTLAHMLLPEGVAPFHSKGIVPGASWSYTFSA